VKSCLFHLISPVTRKQLWRYIFGRICTLLGITNKAVEETHFVPLCACTFNLISATFVKCCSLENVLILPCLFFSNNFILYNCLWFFSLSTGHSRYAGMSFLQCYKSQITNAHNLQALNAYFSKRRQKLKKN